MTNQTQSIEADVQEAKEGESLVQVRDLAKHFHSDGGFLQEETVTHALNGVSFDITEGEVLGVVGESGCGKSTLGMTMLGLHEPTRGEVYFDGQELTAMSENQLRPLREEMQVIFQDSASSLNPRLKVGRIIDEPLREHSSMSREERQAKVAELLEDVGLKPEHADRYPHEFSGGQRQRINVARALSVNPNLIIADEPMSALDLSIQAQLMELLDRLQEEYNLTYLLITHDMSVIRHLADRTMVMYLGEIMELGPTESLFQNPQHPYTEALLSAIPEPGKRRDNRIVLDGEIPDPQNPPSGCPFHTRCHKYIGDICEAQPVERHHVEDQDVACHLYDDDVNTDPSD